MSTIKEEIQAALRLHTPPDDEFMALLERAGADLVALEPPAPPGPRESRGRITVEYSFLDLVDDLWRGDRQTVARIYTAALRDPVQRAAVARAARLVDPDFREVGLWWGAAVGRMPPIETTGREVEASSPTDPWAEFDAALELAGPDIQRSGVLDLCEAELMALAERAKQASRHQRRGTTTSRVQGDI